MGMAAFLVTWPGTFEQTFVPHPKESPYEIWVQLAQWFQRRRCLKMLTDDGRQTTDAGVTGILIAHLWAFGSGELTKNNNNKKFKRLPQKIFHKSNHPLISSVCCLSTWCHRCYHPLIYSVCCLSTWYHKCYHPLIHSVCCLSTWYHKCYHPLIHSVCCLSTWCHKRYHPFPPPPPPQSDKHVHQKYV